MDKRRWRLQTFREGLLAVTCIRQGFEESEQGATDASVGRVPAKG